MIAKRVVMRIYRFSWLLKLMIMGEEGRGETSVSAVTVDKEKCCENLSSYTPVVLVVTHICEREFTKLFRVFVPISTVGQVVLFLSLNRSCDYSFFYSFNFAEKIFVGFFNFSFLSFTSQPPDFVYC